MSDGSDFEVRDEGELLKSHLRSGLPLARVGRARLRLALPPHRERLLEVHTIAFRSLCETYATAVLMVDDLRKEDPCRRDLLEEYEQLCRNIEADAVAMISGGKSPRWR
ncbi:hypothetical protein phi2LM21_p53 [Sinorhizobium phage phi2LM21]|nr:hypothetical protein phi2LM21_p53 [Sinorhizobium phage phi2LM21]OWZ95147.1 hypothetical protein B9J07_06010 [Sinorhizobium sp. LM21]